MMVSTTCFFWMGYRRQRESKEGGIRACAKDDGEEEEET
jgi:hypothetical protein